MKIAISYKKNGAPHVALFSVRVRDSVSVAYAALKRDTRITDLNAGYLVVDVQFATSSRLYTYFTDQVYAPGAQVVVPTPDGEEIVTVVNCEIRSKQAINAVYPFDRIKTILGREKDMPEMVDAN